MIFLGKCRIVACFVPTNTVFYEADRKTYGATWEFDVAEDEGQVWRLRIDNREYQRTLARLQDLVRAASRAGHAVRLRI